MTRHSHGRWMLLGQGQRPYRPAWRRLPGRGPTGGDGCPGPGRAAGGVPRAAARTGHAEASPAEVRIGGWRAQRGQALLWVALLMPTLIGIAGLAIDGATVVTARRELQSVADGAARAGATQVDVGSLRAADGSALRLIPGTGPHTAAGTATAYLASRSKSDVQWRGGLGWRVDVSGPRVSVLVQATVPTAFLRILHVDSVPIDATSSADLRHGIGAPMP